LSYGGTGSVAGSAGGTGAAGAGAGGRGRAVGRRMITTGARVGTGVAITRSSISGATATASVPGVLCPTTRTVSRVMLSTALRSGRFFYFPIYVEVDG